MGITNLGPEPTRIAGPGRIVSMLGALSIAAFAAADNFTGQTTTIAIATPDASADYSIQFVNGSVNETVEASSDGTPSADELGAIFVAEIGKNAILNGQILGTSYAAGVLTIAWKYDANAWAVSFPLNPTSKLSIGSLGAPVAAAQYRFGRFLDPGAAITDSRFLVQQAGYPSLPTRQALLVDITHAGGATYSAQLFVSGVDGSSAVIPVTWAAGVDAAATAAAAVAALNTALAGYAVAEVSTNDAVVTAYAGYTIAVSGPPVASAGALAITQTTAGGGATPSLPVLDNYRTVSALQVNASPIVVGPYPGDTVELLRGGASLGVESPGAVTAGGAVWIETAAGDNRGRPYAAPSATRALHPKAKWIANDPNNSTVAVLAI